MKSVKSLINHATTKLQKVEVDLADVVNFLCNPVGLIGGYAMMRKLRKQKNLLVELRDCLQDRIELFKRNLDKTDNLK